MLVALQVYLSDLNQLAVLLPWPLMMPWYQRSPNWLIQSIPTDVGDIWLTTSPHTTAKLHVYCYTGQNILSYILDVTAVLHFEVRLQFKI